MSGIRPSVSRSRSHQDKLDPVIRKSFASYSAGRIPKEGKPDLTVSTTVDVEKNIQVADLIDDPIGCGFLLQYCIRQFSEENLNFIIDVNRYRELFGRLDPDGVVWNASWREIDQRVMSEQLSTFENTASSSSRRSVGQQIIDGFVNDAHLAENLETINEGIDPSDPSKPESETSEATKPSNGPPASVTTLAETLKRGLAERKKHELWSVLVNLCSEAEQRMQFIHDTYLADTAVSQICMSTKVKVNTLRRMSQLAVCYSHRPSNSFCDFDIRSTVPMSSARHLSTLYSLFVRTYCRDSSRRTSTPSLRSAKLSAAPSPLPPVWSFLPLLLT